MHVGVYQSVPVDGGPMDRLARLAAAIDGEAYDLVVCPELFMSGYNVGAAAIRSRAESADGPFARAASDLARQAGTAIAYGYPEAADGHLYNAAICIGSDGAVLSNRRKIVLPPSHESEVFSPGAGGVGLFDLAGLRCGMLICYETEFPEPVRALALAGAEAVIVPTALAAEWRVVADAMILSRSFENGVWMIYADHAGAEDGLHYAGGSCIVSPWGDVRARAGDGEELIDAVIDAGAVRRARARLPYLADLPALRAGLRGRDG